MAHKGVPRNAPCPCGSGKKYKHCCHGKGFEWREDDAGDVLRSVPIGDDVSAILEEQRKKFVDQFGHEPGPDDPVFFDMPHPEHLEAHMVEDMKQAGINPAIIYAFEKTGLLVTEANQLLIPDKDLDEWDAAIREFEDWQRGLDGRGDS
jgi:hypothetical protein